MRRKIFLHGSLAKLHDGPIEVVSSTIAEAIKIVTRQITGFKPNAIEGYKRIQIVGCDTVESLFDDSSSMEEIHVFPQFNGGKRGGFLQVMIGAALVAASFIPGVGAIAGAGAFLFSVGASVVLGGVLQMFSAPKRDTPTSFAPSTVSGGEAARNHYLGPPRNTVAIGTRIPILYGRRKVGGHFLSVNVNAV